MNLAKVFFVAAMWMVVPSYALVNVGDTMPNLSWKTVEDKTAALSDFKGTITVLLYSAGWCGPCNSEFSELVPAVDEFDGKPVTFVSLSLSGWSSGAKANTQFLQQWKDKFGIPFTVAAAPNAEPYKFFSDVYIPAVVIVDGDGKLAYKAINPGVSAIFSKIKKLLK